MRLDRLFQAALIICAAGCTKDFNDTISCASDLNCPSGYHCATSGKCQTGEAPVRVEWLSPASGAAMRGVQTFSVKVSHPDGVASVKLVAGATQLATFTAPSAGFGASAPAQVDFTAVDTSQAADGSVTIDAQGTSSKGQGGSGSRGFVLDNHESAPFFASGSMSSGNTTNGPRLTGTAATGPTPSNVSLFASPDCSGTAVATGPATDFVGAGIQVPLIPNALTTYSAQSTDALGNVSPCSSSVPGGTVVFTNAQFCADGAITSAQLFSSLLQGCGGKVTFPNRATLCAPGCRPATADEWVANAGALAPTHHYWTDDVLNYSSASGACGQGGCDTNACFVARTNAQSSPCPAAQPMRVCAGNGGSDVADPDGNTCTWTACGYNSVAPKQSFGGCSGTSDNTAGTLCACGIKQWFVSTAGNDGNPGTSAQPFKTVTKALSLARAGETVFVKPGQYGTANGDTLPFNVPAGVLLIGDESSRGTASGQITLLNGTVVPAAGAVVAGFEITAVGTSNGLSASAAGATIRSNTFVGSQQFALQVTAPNQTILLNAFSGNTLGWGILYSGGSTATGKVENNAFTGNSFGMEMDALGGDLGGGPAGSIGNNVFSCNAQADLWMAAGVAVTASNNKWDHATPTTSASDSRAGMDFFTQAGANVTGNSNSIRAGASLAPGTVCP